jgi:hypothetical protein
VLQYHFNWKALSAIAGITWWNFYFQLYQRTIRAPQVVEFLTPSIASSAGPTGIHLGLVGWIVLAQ